MLKRWVHILVGKSSVSVTQGVGKIYSINDIKGYYNDLTGKLCGSLILDDNRIPVCQISGDRFVHFPIAIIQFGLACYDNWLLTGDAESLRDFDRAVEWVMNEQRPDGSWDCFGPIESKKYSVSSMCQGEAASLLLRKYIETKDIVFYEASKKAIDFMLKPIQEGGTANYINEDVMFEEYALPNEVSTVLNGWIFSLFGLFDFIKVSDDPIYIDVYTRTISTLKKYLPLYDTGYWSKYDLLGKIASPAYQALHVALLDVLYDMTQDNDFKMYSSKWKNELESKSKKIRAVSKKCVQKIFEKTDAVIVK